MRASRLGKFAMNSPRAWGSPGELSIMNRMSTLSRRTSVMVSSRTERVGWPTVRLDVHAASSNTIGSARILLRRHRALHRRQEQAVGMAAREVVGVAARGVAIAGQ